MNHPDQRADDRSVSASSRRDELAERRDDPPRQFPDEASAIRALYGRDAK